MKKHFIRGKIFAGDDRRSGVPLCYTLGKAVFTHASNEIKSPFIMVSRDDSAAGEMLQIATGDAICALGGEVLLIDSVSLPAASLLTLKYRADFTVAVAGGYVEILNSAGCNISRGDEQKIEKIIEEGSYFSEETRVKEGEFYCRRDAYLDYCAAIAEMSGNRKIGARIAVECLGGTVKKAARQIFSRLTKNLFFDDGKELKDLVAENGADIGFRFDSAGRNMSVINAKGELIANEDIYCLIAAKMAEKDIFGNTVKDSTKKGIRLLLSENGSIHFGDLLPGADALFTAVMLSVYLADKDEPLHEIIKELSFPQNP